MIPCNPCLISSLVLELKTIQLLLRSMLRAETSRIHDSTMHMGGTGGGGGPPVSARSPLDHVELAYAEQVVRYNAVAVSVSAGGTPKPDLMGKFRALFPEEKEQEISLLWEIVAAMTSDLRRPSASDKWRSTPQVCKEVVARAKRHLEGAFKKFVKASVYSNLKQAQLGGLPGTYHLVKSFLNVKVSVCCVVSKELWGHVLRLQAISSTLHPAL